MQIGRREREAVDRVLRSGRLVQGPEVEAFEFQMAEHLSGTRHAVAVSSGTAALELALAGLDVGPDKEVVTAPFTFGATVNAVLRAGAIVRFADIGPDFTLDPLTVQEAITTRTALLLPIHLYGLPADVDALASFGLPVLEDAAQAHLGMLGDRRAGSLGVAGCFSFFASKNMTTGEGGAVTTDDDVLADRIRVLRNQGMRSPYVYEVVGTNARMTEIAAAIGRVQLASLPKRRAARARNAAVLDEVLDGLVGVTRPIVPEGRTPAWSRYTVRLDAAIDRDAVVDRLRADDIDVRVYYPVILPDMPVYRDHPRVDARRPLEVAREAARTVLCLPLDPRADEREMERIGASVTSAVAAQRVGR